MPVVACTSGFQGIIPLKYDVVIVGAGPAGIFAAIELTQRNNPTVLMLDRGLDINERKCPASRGFECVHCDPCTVLSGWGGAGAFSDGKLTLSTEVGGWLNEYASTKELETLVDCVDAIYLRYGAPDRVYGADVEKVEEIERKASLVGLKLVRQKIRHMGTERCVQTLRKMRQELEGRLEFKPVDVGIRIEVLASVMEELTSALYEPKLVYFSKYFDDQVRTFCVAPYGEVITESYNGVLTVNGQSYAERKTENTNFAVLVSTSFTEPFKEPIAYGKYLARLSNLLSGGVIVQRLGDLEAGRRSTPERISRSVITPTLSNATPGDLSFVLPYRYLADIREMIQALDKISPGIYFRDTLLYGVEVKFYSSKLQLSHCLETKIHNLFTIGDGGGVTRGLVQASASGILVAKEILRREKQRA
jgi:uncharacterized FAD-dependent dehydrogenase